MHAVGPKSTWAPLVSVSSPRAWPIFCANDRLKVEARETPAGKQAAVAPSKKSPPRAPLGPSLTYTGGFRVSNVEYKEYLVEI